MKRVDPNDLSGEEEYEMKAAFGEEAVDNGEIIELEPDDLKKPDKKRWPMADLLEPGDYIEYETRSGKVIEGEVTEVNRYSVTFDRNEEACGVGCGYTGFEAFGGEIGACLELLRVNGEPVDVSYEPYVIEEGDS